MNQILTALKIQARHAMEATDQAWSASLNGLVISLSCGQGSLDFNLENGFSDTGDPLTSEQQTTLFSALSDLVTEHNAGL